MKKKRKEEEEANSKLSSAQQSGDEGGEEISVGEVVKSHGLVTINSGSINDYFAKKMADLKKAKSTTDVQVDQVCDESSKIKGRKKKSKKGADATENKGADLKFEIDQESTKTSHMRTKSEKKLKKAKQTKDDSSVSVSACENVDEVLESSSPVGKKAKSGKGVESDVTESADLEALNPGSKVDEVSKPKKDKKKKNKPTDVANVSEVAPETEGASSKRKKKRKAANEDSMVDSPVNQEPCEVEVKEKKKRKKSREADDVESASADVGKAQKGKKRKKMAEEVEHVDKEVTKPKKKRKSEKSNNAQEEVPTTKGVKNKKADKMRLLRNSAKDCGFKGSNLGEIKSYGCAA